MQQIDYYDRLYGERVPRPDAKYIYSESLETRSSRYDWNIGPHVHPRLYQLFFVEKGSFRLLESNRQTLLNGPCLIMIPPAALHGFEYEEDVTGRILSLTDNWIESLLSTSKAMTQMLGSIRVIHDFDEANSAERIKSLLSMIDEELFHQQAEKQIMLNACLQQLFLMIYRLWQSHEAESACSDHVSLTYYRKFQQRIRQTGQTIPIARLAEELGITHVHLNRVCQQIAGKSAGQLVQEHLLEEACKYLIYTTYSISEIAFMLHFEYPNYFARFFKKLTGVSPKEYREKNGGMV